MISLSEDRFYTCYVRIHFREFSFSLLFFLRKFDICDLQTFKSASHYFYSRTNSRLQYVPQHHGKVSPYYP